MGNRQGLVGPVEKGLSEGRGEESAPGNKDVGQAGLEGDRVAAMVPGVRNPAHRHSLSEIVGAGRVVHHQEVEVLLPGVPLETGRQVGEGRVVARDPKVGGRLRADGNGLPGEGDVPGDRAHLGIGPRDQSGLQGRVREVGGDRAGLDHGGVGGSLLGPAVEEEGEVELGELAGPVDRERDHDLTDTQVGVAAARELGIGVARISSAGRVSRLLSADEDPGAVPGAHIGGVPVVDGDLEVGRAQRIDPCPVYDAISVRGGGERVRPPGEFPPDGHRPLPVIRSRHSPEPSHLLIGHQGLKLLQGRG